MKGGPGRGQGRKPLREGVETVTLSIRLTPEQRKKLAQLGGAQWLRDRIDRAKIPAQRGGEGGIRTHVTTKS